MPDGPSDKSVERRLMTAMALAIVAMMAALGVVYLTLWARAADDLTRLLPASTRAYAAAPAPWASITRTVALPVWQDRERLEAQVLRDGYLAGERAGEIAGLPVESVREILRNMDSVEVALVPTGEGDALLVFVELRDTTQRKRVLARLAPLLETVDRRVGFRIDKLRRRPWQELVGAGIEPPRVADLEPWLVFAWGAPSGLDELLEARVEGRRDALHRREGFTLDASGLGDLQLAVDAGSAWSLFTDREPPPGGLVDYLDLLTIEARAGEIADHVMLRAEITDRDFARTLTRGLQAGDHDLLARAPADALFVVSATGSDLGALVEVVRGLAFRLQRDFEPSADMTSELLVAAGRLPEGGGEIAIVGLPVAGDAIAPLVLVRAVGPAGASTPADALEERLAATLPQRFGDGYAHGEVIHRGTLLHLEIPHALDDDSPPLEPVLAWRQRDGVIELASSVALLDRLAAAPPISPTRLAAARRGLPASSALVAIGDRRLLERSSNPLVRLVTARLKPDFAFGVALDALETHFELRANVGLWTLATAVASASRSEIDGLALAGLEPRCREAYDAFCTLYPNAVPCSPFTFGRRERLEEVCRRLRN